jgi:hypothetical protein
MVYGTPDDMAYNMSVAGLTLSVSRHKRTAGKTGISQVVSIYAQTRRMLGTQVRPPL